MAGREPSPQRAVDPPRGLRPAGLGSVEDIRPGTSNGLAEAINGPLERLRGSALGFRTCGTATLDAYEAGEFRPRHTTP